MIGTIVLMSAFRDNGQLAVIVALSPHFGCRPLRTLLRLCIAASFGFQSGLPYAGQGLPRPDGLLVAYMEHGLRKSKISPTGAPG